MASDKKVLKKSSTKSGKKKPAKNTLKPDDKVFLKKMGGIVLLIVSLVILLILINQDSCCGPSPKLRAIRVARLDAGTDTSNGRTGSLEGNTDKVSTPKPQVIIPLGSPRSEPKTDLRLQGLAQSTTSGQGQGSGTGFSGRGAITPKPQDEAGTDASQGKRIQPPAPEISQELPPQNKAGVPQAPVLTTPPQQPANEPEDEQPVTLKPKPEPPLSNADETSGLPPEVQTPPLIPELVGQDIPTTPLRFEEEEEEEEVAPSIPVPASKVTPSSKRETTLTKPPSPKPPAKKRFIYQRNPALDFLGIYQPLDSGMSSASAWATIRVQKQPSSAPAKPPSAIQYKGKRLPLLLSVVISGALTTYGGFYQSGNTIIRLTWEPRLDGGKYCPYQFARNSRFVYFRSMKNNSSCDKIQPEWTKYLYLPLSD